MILLRRRHPRSPSRRTIPRPSPRPPSCRTMPRSHSSAASALAPRDPRTTAETSGGRPASPASATTPHAPTQNGRNLGMHDDRNLGQLAGLPRVRPRAVQSSALTRPLHPPLPRTILCSLAAASGVQPLLPRQHGSAGPQQKHRGECGGEGWGAMVFRWASEDWWMGREV